MTYGFRDAGFGGGGGGVTPNIVFSTYSATGAPGTSLATIAFDGDEKLDASVTNSSGEFQIPAGLNGEWCLINVSVGCTGAANNRVELAIELQEYQTDTWVTIARADQYAMRNNTQNDGGVYITGFVHQLATGGHLRVQARRQGLPVLSAGLPVFGLAWLP